MTTIGVTLSDERLVQLRSWAEQTGATPEDFLSQVIERILDWREEQFREAMEYVFKKNVELYRRLAQC